MDPATYGIFYHDDYDYLQHLKPVGEDPNGVIINAQKSIEKESGIQFLDKSDAAALGDFSKSKNNLKLPVEVFASNEEMAVGLMNQEASAGNQK